MATATVAPESVGTRDRWGQAWQVARWLTLVLWAVTLLAGALTGARASSYAELQADLVAGQVSRVQVEGALGAPEGFADDVQGVSAVRLVWQDGWHRSVAEVWQASSAAELRSQVPEPVPGENIIGDVGQELRSLSPGVEVTTTPWRSGTSGYFAGWELSGAWSYLPLLLLAVFIAVIVNSPQPRHATRWAWVWLALSPVAIVVTVPAYLILGARPQVPGRWRLNGVGGFLILVLLQS